MSPNISPTYRVAIIGSGLAGLVTAYLLKEDKERRFDVEIFESGKNLSLDSCSVSVSNPYTGSEDRIDVPMRSFAGGYYSNLQAMYDYLGVNYAVQPFLLAFSRVALKGNTNLLECNKKPLQFVHSSNNHRLRPIRPPQLSFVRHAIEIAYLIVCYGWFTACCFIVKPLPAKGDRSCETFGEYIHRVRLPEYFVTNYLLPPFSTVTTCPHKTLLKFPASDIVDYKRKTTGAPHFMVSGGVNRVQEKLSKGVDIRLSAEVIAVELLKEGIKLSWSNSESGSGMIISEKMFDKVVMAVPPNVIRRIFKPLDIEMSHLPTLAVQCTVHTDNSMIEITDHSNILSRLQSERSRNKSKEQIMYLRTSIESEPQTESIHVQPSGVLVTTTPFATIDAEKIIQCSTFTRVLRTPKSRQIVNEILDHAPRTQAQQEEGRIQWRNGDGDIWIVGGWCWDGMVLLEGCVHSAIAVADALEVRVPWRKL